ncbi:MAG: non-heme chloroperoxidase [Pseudomonadota bacterium]|nr:non-heme chloroperoxidase [Pseudomonadota bacterium]MDQ5882274.1 non-heme chloroperoxidase [Pseudomonadota bacterium]MDQ5908602.1 non-heme chloroperoxidase [Pseudomonadota bacterium]MDQ5916140.1 non-heme chloroperoxidase [Pseudomonadota bacterium]MDQ5917386.1 non-heme chloroperoxidase [Pseudomonadota bacterium]
MSHFFADDGEKLHLKISGEGPPLVMLHGWTASHQEWFPFLAELNKHHTVYRWDARGHGGHSLLTSTAPTVSRMAKDLFNLLEHFDLADVCAVGHSMGALTLWQYIRDFSAARLGKICLIDQSPRLLTDDDWSNGIYGNFDRSRANSFVAELEQNFAESVLRLSALGLNARAREKYLENAKGWEKSRTWLGQLDAKPLITCWQSLTEADYRDVLEQIRIPALLIYGGESNFYHGSTATFVRDCIPEAILHIYEGTDHSPHQWQRERFTQDLLRFAS